MVPDFHCLYLLANPDSIKLFTEWWEEITVRHKAKKQEIGLADQYRNQKRCKSTKRSAAWMLTTVRENVCNNSKKRKIRILEHLCWPIYVYMTLTKWRLEANGGPFAVSSVVRWLSSGSDDVRRMTVWVHDWHFSKWWILMHSKARRLRAWTTLGYFIVISQTDVLHEVFLQLPQWILPLKYQ